MKHWLAAVYRNGVMKAEIERPKAATRKEDFFVS